MAAECTSSHAAKDAAPCAASGSSQGCACIQKRVEERPNGRPPTRTIGANRAHCYRLQRLQVDIVVGK